MNTVLNSYGQLCGCPEILKKSCKFFCRGLDIRVTDYMTMRRAAGFRPGRQRRPLYYRTTKKQRIGAG